MLFWICPECGCECSPAVRECPTCAAAERAASQGERSGAGRASESAAAVLDGVASRPVSVPQESSIQEGILALVQEFRTQPATLLLAGPQRELISAGGYSSPEAPVSDSSLSTFTEEQPCPAEQIDSLVRPLVESAEQAASLEQAPSTDEAPPAEPAPPEEPLAPPQVPEPAEPTTLAEALEQDARFVLDAITPRSQLAETLDDIRRASEFQAQAVLDSIAEQLEVERAGVAAILESFADRPVASLLDAARDVVIAPAPPALDLVRTSAPSIAPAGPSEPDLAALAVGPQAPTLNGPCIPPQLVNLRDVRPAAEVPPGKRSRMATLMLSCLLATGLLLGGVSLLQYLNSDRDGKAAATSGQPSGRSLPGSPADTGSQEHSAAKSVEVAGIRITNGSNHRPLLQYIVINHSAKELTGLAIRLALRSQNDPQTAAPLLTVSSKVPALGAYQSREIRTELDADQRALPDWQTLRTDVVVSGQ